MLISRVCDCAEVGRLRLFQQIFDFLIVHAALSKVKTASSHEQPSVFICLSWKMSFISQTSLQPQTRMIPPQKTAEQFNFAFKISSSKCSHSFEGLLINGGEVLKRAHPIAVNSDDGQR